MSLLAVGKQHPGAPLAPTPRPQLGVLTRRRLPREPGGLRGGSWASAEGESYPVQITVSCKEARNQVST